MSERREYFIDRKYVAKGLPVWDLYINGVFWKRYDMTNAVQSQECRDKREQLRLDGYGQVPSPWWRERA